MAVRDNGPKLSGLEYRVVRTIGTGAGSTILLIADAKTGARYALKVVRRQSEEDDVYVWQAQHEYDVAQRLDHPGIVTIHDIRTKKSWFKVKGVELLEEYVDGPVLDDLDAPRIDELVMIFHQIAAALGHMHRRGVYHGDLKPGNLMLTSRGTAKVIDLGTAWIKGQDKARVQGTPFYMAPEQATDRIVDEKTDLYNLGATMYRMFTGEYANLGIPTGDLKMLARSRQPAIRVNPHLPRALNDVIMACLEGEREARPADVGVVKDALERVARKMGLDPDGRVELRA